MLPSQNQLFPLGVESCIRTKKFNKQNLPNQKSLANVVWPPQDPNRTCGILMHYVQPWQFYAPSCSGPATSGPGPASPTMSPCAVSRITAMPALSWNLERVPSMSGVCCKKAFKGTCQTSWHESTGANTKLWHWICVHHRSMIPCLRHMIKTPGTPKTPKITRLLEIIGALKFQVQTWKKLSRQETPNSAGGAGG